MKGDEELKLKMILAGIVIVLISGTIVFFSIRTEKSETVQHENIAEDEQGDDMEEENNNGKRELRFDGFDQLAQYMNEDQRKQTERKIRDFLSTDAQYDQVSCITCEGVINTENKIEFYCVFDTVKEYVLYVTYDKTEDSLLQWTEKISREDAGKQWEERADQFIDTSDWPEENQLPQEWDYVEEKGETSDESDEEN